KYGARPTAPAARLKPLDNYVVKHRSERAATLARAIAARRNSRFVGRLLEVRFVERGASAKGEAAGRSEEYAQVIAKQGARLGEKQRVKIIGASTACLQGEIVESRAPRVRKLFKRSTD
ncbi:MAG: hypothetical protein QW343_02335, partial [Candidatus Norongarragalinales archaeon]